MKEVFGNCGMLAHLAVKASTCFIAPHVRHNQAPLLQRRHGQWLRNRIPQWKEFKVVAMLTSLGITMGPGA
eukprot:1060214-Pyramimonas_sp.AAC.1